MLDIDKIFTQEDYNFMVNTLDKLVDRLKEDFGKSDMQVKEWLEDFMKYHYWGVWRMMKEDK